MRAYEFVFEDNPDYDEDRYLKSDPGTPLSFPKGTTLVNVSDVYDWYKLGMAVSDLDDADPRTFNKGVPHTVFAFGSEEEEHKMIPLLKRLGFSLHDIDSPEDYQKAIRADEAIAHLEEIVERRVINDDNELPNMGKDTWAGGGTEFEPDWHQEVGVDAGHGYQRASGNLPGGLNLSIAADEPSSTTFMPQRGVNIAKGPASLYIGDRGSVAGTYNIPVGNDSSVSLNAAGQKDQGIQSYGLNYQKGGFNAGVSKGTWAGADPQFNVGYSKQFEEDADVEEGKIISDRELVDVYLKGKHYDQIIQKKVAERIPNSIVHAFIEKVAAKFGLNPSAFIYGPSRENEVTEMAGKVHGGVRKVLKDKGYRYLGSGIDKQAWLEPSTGQVLLIFGYRPGNKENFSPDQRMFIDWINYCNANKNNPSLPRFSGFESFEFQGKNYIQARMEALQELSPDLRRIVHYIDQFTDQIGKRDFDQIFAKLGTDAEAVVRYLGGRQSAERLLKTVNTVDKFGRKHGYSLDLHSSNYMQRPDGTIVVNDPFVHWMDRLGS